MGEERGRVARRLPIDIGEGKLKVVQKMIWKWVLTVWDELVKGVRL